MKLLFKVRGHSMLYKPLAQLKHHSILIFGGTGGWWDTTGALRWWNAREQGRVQRLFATWVVCQSTYNARESITPSSDQKQLSNHQRLNWVAMWPVVDSGPVVVVDPRVVADERVVTVAMKAIQTFPFPERQLWLKVNIGSGTSNRLTLILIHVASNQVGLEKSNYAWLLPHPYIRQIFLKWGSVLGPSWPLPTIVLSR